MRVLAIAVSFAALFGSNLARAEGLSLETVIQLALSRNERAQIAAAKIESADAAVAKARSGFLPTVALNASETLRPYSVEQNGKTVVRSNSATASLSVTQPLLDLTVFPAYSAAKHDRAAARHEAKNDRRELAFEAAHAFFQVLAQDQVLQAAQRRLERAEASLTSTKAQAAAQIVGSNDVTRAEIERSGAARSVALADGNLRKARVELSFLIAAPADGPLQRPTRPLAAGTARNASALTERALPLRPDLASIQESAAAAHASEDEPGLRFAPKLDLVGQARVNDAPGAGDRYWDVTASLNLSWIIWDGGARGADSDARRAAANIADLQVQAQKRKVSAEVQTALVSLESAEKSRAVAEQQATAARRGAEESAVLYREGLARAIELVDANLTRFEAEVQLAQADFDLAQAQLDLRAALGLFPIDEAR